MIHFGNLYMYKYQEMRIQVFDFPFFRGKRRIRFNYGSFVG